MVKINRATSFIYLYLIYPQFLSSLLHTLLHLSSSVSSVETQILVLLPLTSTSALIGEDSEQIYRKIPFCTFLCTIQKNLTK